MSIKLSTDHDIWEVWCEHMAEAVYVDHKPNKEELEEIRKKNWPGTDQWDMPYTLQIFKLKPFYTRSKPNISSNTNIDKCGYCGGYGEILDDGYSRSTCPWCNGDGRGKNE